MPKYNDFELDVQINLAYSRPGNTIAEGNDSAECGDSDYCGGGSGRHELSVTATNK